jgi:hypothetical protein
LKSYIPARLLLSLGALAVTAPTLAEFRRLCDEYLPCEPPHTHQEVPYAILATATATATSTST